MGKKIIITAGPTDERIDDVMQITNNSAGTLASIITESCLTLTGDGGLPIVDKVYYMCNKKTKQPAGLGDRLETVNVTDAEDLLAKMTEILKRERIDAVIHNAAVGDYKGRYVITAEALAKDILYRSDQKRRALTYDELLNILVDPDSDMDRDGKLSSCEKNLMVMLDLTPKVIQKIKKIAPDTMLIGSKLLDGVSHDDLMQAAIGIMQKSFANYVIANDLSKIKNGNHPATIVAADGHTWACQTKTEIAGMIADIVAAGHPARKPDGGL